MSDVSGSSSAPPPPSGTPRVSPAPVTPGQTDQHKTPTQGEPQTQTTPQQAPPDTAVTLAPSLAGLSEGETVNVTVLSHDADGRQIVQAPQSVLVTLDPEPLPALATATIRVTGLAHDHLRAQLTAVDGEPTPTPHAIRLRVVQVSFPNSPADTPDTTIPNAPPSPQPPALQVGTVVATQAAPPTPIATVTAAASGGPSAPGGRATLPPSTATFFRVIAATPPTSAHPASRTESANAATAAATTKPVTSSGPTAPVTTGARPSNTGAPAASPSARTPTPSQGVSPPQSTGAALRGPTPPTVTSPSSTPTPTQVVGTIAASPRPDQTVVTTSRGTIVLAQPAPTHWPEGTTVVLEAIDTRVDTPATALAAAAAAPAAATATATRPLDQVLMTLGEDWPALRDLAAHTATAAPPTAQSFVEGKIPAANARAAAQIMFFLSVLRSGDVAGWLGGDMMRSLERAGQRGLVERLGDDFRQLRRLGDQTSTNDWRLLMFPFASGDKIEPIHMFVRGQRRDQSDGDQDIRFVVDLKMSALGALQFDGLLHQKTFDLMVRSHTELGEPQREDITRIFNRGLDAIGYRGQIGFQTVKEFPVSPFNDLLGGRHTPGTIVA